jgi:hypothetical protein
MIHKKTYHVPEQDPRTDQRIITSSRRFLHNIFIWWVESQSSCGRAVRNKIDPQKLYRNEAFWYT